MAYIIPLHREWQRVAIYPSLCLCMALNLATEKYKWGILICSKWHLTWDHRRKSHYYLHCYNLEREHIHVTCMLHVCVPPLPPGSAPMPRTHVNCICFPRMHITNNFMFIYVHTRGITLISHSTAGHYIIFDIQWCGAANTIHICITVLPIMQIKVNDLLVCHIST